MAITLPTPLHAPDILDYSAEAQYIRFYNEAIALAALLNSNALAVFKHKCEFWLLNYVVYQNNKLPIPDKPEPPLGYVIEVVNGEPQPVLSATELADPCPDPAPDKVVVIPAPPDPVGEFFGGRDPWFRVVPGDTTPIGGKYTDSRGTFVRSQQLTPWGAFQYWARV